MPQDSHKSPSPTQPSPNDEQNIPGVAAQPDSYFFTGKPYDKELGGYVFAARTYDPELCRWTTPDPFGFPDGPNNRIYAPVPTNGLDNNGLLSVTGVTTPNLSSALSTSNGVKITVSAITATQINSDFWETYGNYAFSSGNSNATLNIANYSAFKGTSNGEDVGGVSVNVNVNGAVNGDHWIQIVSANYSPNGGLVPKGGLFGYFDNDGESTPFYDVAFNQGSTFFADIPSSTFFSGTYFRADLYYVHDNGIQQNGVDSVTVYGGFNYGWAME